MSNALFPMAACIFFSLTANAVATSAQEASFMHVALEQLRDRMERDDKGTLDEFVAEVSAASGLSATASRDSLVSLVRDLKTHCKKSTALGEQLFALHGAHFSEREAKAYLVRVVDMAGDFLKEEANVGLEPLIARAAGKSKLLKFQALDYTKALLVPFVGSPGAEESVEEDAVQVPTGIFKVLVRTRNGEDLPNQVKEMVELHGQGNGVAFFRVFNVSPLQKMRAKRKVLALHESVRPALLDEFKRFSHVRFTTDPLAKDMRYTLDYIVNGYWVGFYYNVEQRLLWSQVQLVVQDVLRDEVVLDQALVIKQGFTEELKSDDESILDDFYQEAARTVAQEVSPLFD